MEYNFFADLLNKFSQLTPWIQAMSVGSITAIIVSPFYFLKEIARVIADRYKDPKKEWQDKFYRDEDIRN